MIAHVGVLAVLAKCSATGGFIYSELEWVAQEVENTIVKIMNEAAAK